MRPAIHDITVYRGDSFELYFRLREKIWNIGTNAWVPGDYMNLTGWVGKAQMRPTRESDAPLTVEMSVTLDNQTTTPGAGFMRMTAAQTAGITVDSGFYDLQFTLPDTTVQTVITGSVTVDPDVTRA